MFINKEEIVKGKKTERSPLENGQELITSFKKMGSVTKVLSGAKKNN